MTLLPVLAMTLACATPSVDPDPPSWLEKTDQVRRLSCYRGEAFGSRVGTSPALVSPDGSKRVWSEVQSIASQPGDETTRSCRNISRLWMEEEGSAARTIFEQNPGAEGRNGNSIVPVAWSADGRQLLFELETWTYYTDREPPILAVWTDGEDEIRRITVEPGMRAHRGEDCAFALQALGFEPDGRVLVTTAPLPQEEARGLGPCAPAPQRWRVALDGTIEEIRP